MDQSLFELNIAFVQSHYCLSGNLYTLSHFIPLKEACLGGEQNIS
jgi:hypothetical protein